MFESQATQSHDAGSNFILQFLNDIAKDDCKDLFRRLNREMTQLVCKASLFRWYKEITLSLYRLDPDYTIKSCEEFIEDLKQTRRNELIESARKRRSGESNNMNPSTNETSNGEPTPGGSGTQAGQQPEKEVRNSVTDDEVEEIPLVLSPINKDRDDHLFTVNPAKAYVDLSNLSNEYFENPFTCDVHCCNAYIYKTTPMPNEEVELAACYRKIHLRLAPLQSCEIPLQAFQQPSNKNVLEAGKSQTTEVGDNAGREERRSKSPPKNREKRSPSRDRRRNSKDNRRSTSRNKSRDNGHRSRSNSRDRRERRGRRSQSQRRDDRRSRSDSPRRHRSYSRSRRSRSREHYRRSSKERYDSSYVKPGETSYGYYPHVKITPVKFSKGMEFRLWFDRFQMYVMRFSFREAFSLENPKRIENDEVLRSEARAALVEWLDEDFIRMIYGEKCPTECLRRIQVFSEPRTRYDRRLLGDIQIKTYKLNESLSTWISEFENMHRKLTITCKIWSDELMLETFLNHMRTPLPNVLLRVETLMLKSGYSDENLSKDKIRLLYEEAKGMALEEEKVIKDRKDQFKLDRLAAKQAKRQEYKGKKKNKYSHRSPTKYRRSKQNFVTLEQRQCYNCGRMGHIAVKCRDPKRPREREVRNRRETNDYRKNTNADQSRRESPKGEQPKKKLSSKQFKKAFQAMLESGYEIESSEESDRRSKSGERPAGIRVTRVIYGNCNPSSRKTSGKVNNKNRKLKMICDSGATDHFINDLSLLHNAKKLSNPVDISCANKSEEANMQATHRGFMVIKGKNSKNLVLKKVLYAPELGDNLLSVSRLDDENMTCILSKGKVKIVNGENQDECILEGKKSNGFYWLEVNSINASNEQHQAWLTKEQEESQEAYVHDHSYTNMRDEEIWAESSENSEQVQETVLDQIEIDAEVNKDELEKIKEVNSDSIRKKLGMLYHIRLGHASVDYLREAAKSITCLRGVKFEEEIRDCEVCRIAKIRRRPHTKRREIANKPLARVHSDLVGPIKPLGATSKGSYVVTFVDDFSRFAAAYNLSDKIGVADAFEDYLKQVRSTLGDEKLKVLNLRIDGGREYMTQSMKQLIKRGGIWIETAPPNTPQLNGVAERVNLTILQKVRALILDSGLPQEFWDLAVRQVIHVYNRLPHKSLNMRTPYEVFTGRTPTVKYIKRFGSIAYKKLSKTKGTVSKVGPQGEKCIVVGCHPDAWLVIVESKNKTKLVRCSDLEFTESVVFRDSYAKDYFEKVGFPVVEFENTDQNESREPYELNFEEQINEDYVTDASGRSTKRRRNNPTECKVEKRMRVETKAGAREIRTVIDPNRNYTESDPEIFTKVQSLVCKAGETPKTYKEMLRCSNSQEWLSACKNELKSQDENKTWKYVDRPSKNEKVIDSRWVFTKKVLPDGKAKFKARLVIRGFKDCSSYDFTEVFAPVVGQVEVKALFSLANKKQWEIHQMDVETAFLNGELDQKVYMEIPEGVDVSEKFRKGKVCLVEKALYGLKVSPKRWYIKFREAICKFGFSVFECQACIFSWRKENRVVIVALYVDDILIVGNCRDKIIELKRNLNNKFKMKDLGTPKRFLGMEISIDRKQQCIKLSQTKFIEVILKRFEAENLKGSLIPMKTNQSESKSKSSTSLKDYATGVPQNNIPYREAIGALLYLSNCTRPDIAYAVNFLARRCHDYSEDDWKKVEKVFKYIKLTAEKGLKFYSGENKLVGFSDASLGVNEESGRSTTGFILKIFGDTIMWGSNRQRVVATSSMEAEYIAMSRAAKELVYVKNFCEKLAKIVVHPVLYCDSQSAITAAKSEVVKALKHLVKLKYHFIRQLVQEKEIQLVWVTTNEQLADCLTKALPRSNETDSRSLLSDRQYWIRDLKKQKEN